jgi:uncharacterized membrane protein YjjP (DUF1212 family)
MAATVAILDLVSVYYLTNTVVDWSDFFVAYCVSVYWGGDWRFLSMAAILVLVSIDYLTNASVD